MKWIGLIPARYASTRFPGKPLALLGGKPIIQWVYERAHEALDDAVVATDDERILDVVRGFGGKAVMTSTAHQSGTDRIEEALNKIGMDYDGVVNIQGDEPFIDKRQIKALCDCFDDARTQIATLGMKITQVEDILNPNIVKIVTDNDGYALYFSRAAIPFVRGTEQSEWLNHANYLRHLGIYAYRAEVLHAVTRLPQSSLEQAERLEQLRWLQNGYKIRVGLTDIATIGIDTPEDLANAEAKIKE